MTDVDDSAAETGRATAQYPEITARIQDRHCPHCMGIHTGWVIYERVGPNLPQRSISFRCPSCKTILSKGLVYWYDDEDEQLVTDGGEDVVQTMEQKGWSDWRYIAKIRIDIHRQRIEDGYSLDDFEDRLEGDIESEHVYCGFEQVNGPDQESVMPVIDMSEIEQVGGRDV